MVIPKKDGGVGGMGQAVCPSKSRTFIHPWISELLTLKPLDVKHTLALRLLLLD